MFILRHLVYFSVVALSLFYSTNTVFANSISIYDDDFVTLDLDKWIVNDHQNEVLIDHDSSSLNYIQISSQADQELPFLMLNIDLSQYNNLTIEAKYRITSLGFGSGLILSNKQLNAYSDLDMALNDFIFVTWPNGEGGYGVVSRLCPAYQNICPHENFGGEIFRINDLSWHNIKFQYLNNKYNIHIDNNLVFESELSDLRIKHIYLGSPHKTATVTPWPTHNLDYIKITAEEEVPSPPKSKIIIIPGFGASWDIDALLSGESDGNWIVPDFVDLYNNLINSITNNGYEINNDLFLFGYDWRKTLDNLASDLNSYIESRKDTADKFILVGHSMGGLVARAYEQKYGSESIDKIITIGSPHLGTLDMYSVWEGATVWGNIWWEKAALELAVHLNNNIGESRVSTLRRLAPGVLDILPTYDFLSFKGVIKDRNNMLQKNDYLHEMNTNNTNVVIKPFVGSGSETKYILKAATRNNLDRLFGRWEDGRPIDTDPFVFADGDNTVTKTSAVGPFTSFLETEKSHNGLIYEREGVENIISELGLNKSRVQIAEVDSRDSFLAVALRSPGKIHVCNEAKTICDENLGLYFPDNNLFLKPQYDGGKLFVEVAEDGMGEYHLHVGDIGEAEKWSVTVGSIDVDNQIDEYVIQGSQQNINIYPELNTSDRNLINMDKILSEYSPKWNTRNYFDNINNTNLSAGVRLKNIKLLRSVLRAEFKKSIKQNNPNYFSAVDNIWQATDQVSIDLLKGQRKTLKLIADAYQNRIDKQIATVNGRLTKTNKYLSGLLFELALNKLEYIKKIDALDTDLRNDLLMSVEYLLYSTLDSL